MTRSIAPVLGSRSMRASVGVKVVGTLDLMEKLSFFGAVVANEDVMDEGDFSVPPVEALSFEVRPRRR